MNITVRTYQDSDVSAMVRIWNEVVEEGLAFPQEENLTEETGRAFFREQTHCGVAVNEAGTVLGMYILHPNNVGRCGHICNTSYAVAAAIQTAKEKFAADRITIEAQVYARTLYEKAGFRQTSEEFLEDGIPHIQMQLEL